MGSGDVDRALPGQRARVRIDAMLVAAGWVPFSGRRFTDLYKEQHLTHNRLDTVASVCVGTIQRVHSMLRGEPDLPALPIEAFDVIVVDGCHEPIDGGWRQVLSYFDAFLVGLTAMPDQQTLELFDENPVMSRRAT